MGKLLVLVMLFSSSIASAEEIKNRYFLKKTAVEKKHLNRTKMKHFPLQVKIIGRVNNYAIVRTNQGKVIVVKLGSEEKR